MIQWWEGLLLFIVGIVVGMTIFILCAHDEESASKYIKR